MFKIKIYCNDNGKYYWEDGVETYETYDKGCRGKLIESGIYY